VTAQEIFGKNVNKLRTHKGLTQTMLADLATIDRRFLQRIESGQSAPTIETMSRLRRALRCSWNDLIANIP
jgi:transcriptional regulator with XRE-family HTH domain